MKSLAKTAFRQWLENQAPESVVGYAHFGAFCPYRAYLEATHVSRYSAFFSEGPRASVNLPEWTSDFIERIDHILKNEDNVEIQAWQALELLARDE